MFYYFTLEVTNNFQSYSMAIFCHLDQHRSKNVGRNSLAIDQEVKKAGLSMHSNAFPFYVY